MEAYIMVKAYRTAFEKNSRWKFTVTFWPMIPQAQTTEMWVAHMTSKAPCSCIL